MRKVIVSEFITLDGVAEDPGGAEGFEHGGWSFKFFSPEAAKYKLDELMSAGGLLLGRVTYEGFAKAWPSMKDDAGFADRMNGLPKYVASTTLRDPEWSNAHVLEGDAADAVRSLKEEDGQDLLVAGSLSFSRYLLEHDLVDEIRLMMHPIVLGGGRRLFDGAPVRTLELVHHEVWDTGTAILHYAPVAS
jgi:dihydrofolate reductase